MLAQDLLIKFWRVILCVAMSFRIICIFAGSLISGYINAYRLHFKGISSESHLNFIQTVWGEQRITILERLSQRASKDAIPFWSYFLRCVPPRIRSGFEGDIFNCINVFLQLIMQVICRNSRRGARVYFFRIEKVLI